MSKKRTTKAQRIKAIVQEIKRDVAAREHWDSRIKQAQDNKLHIVNNLLLLDEKLNKELGAN